MSYWSHCFITPCHTTNLLLNYKQMVYEDNWWIFDKNMLSYQHRQSHCYVEIRRYYYFTSKHVHLSFTRSHKATAIGALTCLCVLLGICKTNPAFMHTIGLMLRAINTSSTDQDTWWRHQMETFSALLAIYAGNSPVTGEFSAQRPVTLICSLPAKIWIYYAISSMKICEMYRKGCSVTSCLWMFLKLIIWFSPLGIDWLMILM